MKQLLLISLLTCGAVNAAATSAAASKQSDEATEKTAAQAPKKANPTKVFEYKACIEAVINNWSLFEQYGEPIHDGESWVDKSVAGLALAKMILVMQKDAIPAPEDVKRVYEVLASKVQQHANPGIPEYVFAHTRGLSYLQRVKPAHLFKTSETGE